MTFLLTDLEGSTRMWEQDPEAMKAAMVPLEDTLIEMPKQKQVLLCSTTANTCWGRWPRGRQA